MSGDLIERLRQQAHNRTAHFDADAYKATPEWQAATLIEAQAAEIERLKADRLKQIDYGCDLQRIIEDICHQGPIRTPKTTARFHYDKAVEYRSRAETAERALAEAVEVIDRLSSFQIAETHARTGKLSDLCKAWIDHKRAARNLVKEREK